MYRGTNFFRSSIYVQLNKVVGRAVVQKSRWKSFIEKLLEELYIKVVSIVVEYRARKVVEKALLTIFSDRTETDIFFTTFFGGRKKIIILLIKVVIRSFF